MVHGQSAVTKEVYLSQSAYYCHAVCIRRLLHANSQSEFQLLKKNEIYNHEPAHVPDNSVLILEFTDRLHCSIYKSPSVV